MSEKLKPNFTPIPNVLLDEIMRTLAPGATKVLFAICRYTYGWGKPEGDRISLRQLEDVTGMARGSVIRSLKELGSVVSVIPGDPSRQLASQYRINIEISDDNLVSLRDRRLGSKRDQGSLLASLSGETFQRKSKEKRKADSFFPAIQSILRRLNELTDRTFPFDSNALCKYLRARLKEGNTEADCLAVVEDRWRRWGGSEKMREFCNPVTLFRKENFERYLAEANAKDNGAERFQLGEGFVG